MLISNIHDAKSNLSSLIAQALAGKQVKLPRRENQSSNLSDIFLKKFKEFLVFLKGRLGCLMILPMRVQRLKKCFQ